ncbi:NAD(P)/FAD-dependent oxidoreductase [Bacillus sp. 3255]|uniref:FAD-dependent oxidoreductase n=1 Tax=Bacillus sp. 3255 TaxID=2817904 RepID=UPI002863F494|nr:NAD(P)/FAD-dependent oxidoreductase [Bacillus sp. 3255]MDR6879876.1 2-polyprenyl-6-methoxyphenol hydroxylase-like FAD-dependent oxidoreductase [Bacillus sp. 3255]
MSIKQLNEQPRIAIIGAGPGGLTFARILQRHGVPCIVYERDSSPASRQQGGSLDIHEDTGQWALKEAGLYEQFQTYARYEGQDFRLLDKTGRVYLDERAESNEGDRPEIDRSVLRQLLVDAVDPDTIKWGHQLDKAVPMAGGRHELYFENGHRHIVDLVVAADGAFSRIRPLLTDAAPIYSGLSMVELSIENAAVMHPDIAAFNRRGKLFALDDHKGILAQLNGDGRICVYLAFLAERDWLDTCGIPFDKPEEAKPMLLTYYHDWDEALRTYIQAAQGDMMPRRIYMLPEGLKWPHKPGVTLIGDAAHLMSPFAGEGVNLAMRDAAELALAILRSGDVNQAIQTYETKMYEYASVSAKESGANLELCFSEHAAAKLMDLMQAYHDHSSSSTL